MTKERLLYLYQRYMSLSFTQAEMEELNAYLSDPAWKETIDELLDNAWENLSHQQLDDFSQAESDRFFELIVSRGKRKPVVRYRWLKIAAVLFISCSVGLWLWNYGRYKNIQPGQGQAAVRLHDVAPGGNKAMLTLSNGQHVMLDSVHNGQVARQAGTVINKVKSGQLVYAATNSYKTGGTQEWNTITVPKGGEYQVTLADGTRVYMNAASSLTFPTSFPGSRRQVTLVGEAYFEVAKNPAQPFVVNVAGRQQVEVLGTHFNIEAYPDEEVMNTTLLEGSVRLTYGKEKTVLKPGQMASATGGELQIDQADEDEVMAWRNGIFIFNNENIRDLMKRVSRWYNVDVVFKGDMSGINFIGSYSRTRSLSNLLKNIELTGKVYFIVEERRVTVIEKTIR